MMRGINMRYPDFAPMEEDSLAWRIIQELFFTDELMTKYDLASELSVGFSEINGILYRHSPDQFITDGVRPGTSQPFWKLSDQAYDFMTEFHKDRENNIASIPEIFCKGILGDETICNSLMPKGFCDREGCSLNPVPKGAIFVPSEITGGSGKSILKLFGYSAGMKTKRERRQKRLILAVEANYWTPENAKNANYVKSFDQPNSSYRCQRLIELLQGFNVPMPLGTREEDIEFLDDYCRQNIPK